MWDKRKFFDFRLGFLVKFFCPVENILGKMRDPIFFKDVVQDDIKFKLDSKIHLSWNDISIAEGYSSLLLLFSHLQKKGMLKGDNESAPHFCVLKIKESIEKKGVDDFSLFTGLAGTCFAIQQASMDGKRYKRVLSTIQALLIEGVNQKYIIPLKQTLEQGTPIFSAYYDVIVGLCGIGRYSLENLSSPGFSEITQDITNLLIQLTYPKLINGQKVPGWHLCKNDPTNHKLKPAGFEGNFNLGLAHGITGVLAFLSITALKGFLIKGQKEAINCIADWICQKSFTVGSKIRWPYTISWKEELQNIVQHREAARDAWCYGVPGIARSLFLAGKALNNKELQRFAISAFRGVFCRTQEEWKLSGPSLCHGIAGLLLITSEMARESECKDLVEKVSDLKQILLSFYNPNTPFGFQDFQFSEKGKLMKLNKIGFLEGCTGVLLTLDTLSETGNQWSLPMMVNV